MLCVHDVRGICRLPRAPTFFAYCARRTFFRVCLVVDGMQQDISKGYELCYACLGLQIFLALV